MATNFEYEIVFFFVVFIDFLQFQVICILEIFYYRKIRPSPSQQFVFKETPTRGSGLLTLNAVPPRAAGATAATGPGAAECRRWGPGGVLKSGH